MRAKLTRVPLREGLRAAEAAVSLLRARWLLRFAAVEEMQAWATRRGNRSRDREEVLLAFGRASRRLRGTCLARALALQSLLSRYGHASELRIGVGRTGKGFEAHAWLVCDDETLEGGGQEAEQFEVLARWQTSY